MYLLKLYSEPHGLLSLYANTNVVEFVDGLNVIYGKKTASGASLNSIGKSTLVDLIDYCLLATIQKGTRLQKARDAGIFQDYKIVLEFSVDNEIYVIKRGFTDSAIEFGQPNVTELYNRKELVPILFDLIFYKSNFDGVQSSGWFRSLISFYLKIQRKSTDKFSDPIKYLPYSRISELNQYHMYFLGINNELVCENYLIQEDLRTKNALIKEVEKIVQETYDLRIPEANTRINRLQREIGELQRALELFQLTEHYREAESRANQLTVLIKELWYSNYSDRKRLDAYRESYALADSGISTRRIGNLYNEFNNLFGTNTKRVLDEAIGFRVKLAESRKEFVAQEMAALEDAIQRRSAQIEEYENQRASLFRILSETEAISDLTNGFYEIGQRQKLLSELEGQIKLYRDLSRERANLQTRESLLVERLLDYVEEMGESITDFYEVFSQIYKAIYPQSGDQPRFGIDINSKTEAKLQIDISFAGDEGQGRNQSRTLIYDLAVLLFSIRKGIKGPRFLIHDGIFNGMDKAHFIAVYEFIEKQKELLLSRNERFQYIVTLNEEGTLSNNFGRSDKVYPEKLEREAIAVLSPESKLFGRDF